MSSTSDDVFRKPSSPYYYKFQRKRKHSSSECFSPSKDMPYKTVANDKLEVSTITGETCMPEHIIHSSTNSNANSMQNIDFVSNISTNDRFNFQYDYLEKPGSGNSLELDIKQNSDATTGDINDKKLDEIIEGMNDEINNMLEATAEKNKLTATNVKSILRHVITNEYVLSMVKNTMKSTEDTEAELEEAIFEPKLTRSKAKELREKRARLPWPVSSPAKPNVPKKLLEEEFSSDNSSDEEYQPNEEECHTDEEDLSSYKESNVCSPHSESEKNFCSSPDKTSSWEVDPPLVIADVPDILHSDEVDLIALRTRSKLPLTDTPLETIEASFVAPDITVDMYDTRCNDEDWQQFLHEFSKPYDVGMSLEQPDDDAEDDPEYNVLDDVDEDDDKKAIKISRKELNGLMAEILETAEEELIDNDDDEEEDIRNIEKPCDYAETQSVVQLPEIVDQSAVKECNSTVFSETQKLQLAEQMRMHVQLLTQSFLLCHGVKELSGMTQSSVALLENLNGLSKQALDKTKSYFCPDNLDESLSIVHWYQSGKIVPIDSPKCYDKRAISIQAKTTMAHSKAFIYPQLLPVITFKPSISFKKRVYFTNAEDMLLALGLEQFSGTKQCINLIQSRFLPTKTVQQIKLRIKKSKAATGINPVKYFFLNGHAPPITTHVQFYDPAQVKKPCELSTDVLPDWMLPYTRTAEEAKKLHNSLEIKTNILPKIQTKTHFKPKIQTKLRRILPRLSDNSSTVSPELNVQSNISSCTHSFNFDSVLQPLYDEVFQQIPVPLKPSVNQIFPISAPSPSCLPQVVSSKDFFLPALSPIVTTVDTQLTSLGMSTSYQQKPNLYVKKPEDEVQDKNRFVKLPMTSLKSSSLQLSIKNSEINVHEVTSESKSPFKTEHVSSIYDCKNKALFGKGKSTQSSLHNDINSIATSTLEYTSVNEPVKSSLLNCNENISPNNQITPVSTKISNECDEEDLAALMKASSTICKKQPQIEKLKFFRSFNALIDEFAMDISKNKDGILSCFLILRVMRAFEEKKKFDEFIKLVRSYEFSVKPHIKIYQEVYKCLKDYPIIADEFLIFFHPVVAKKYGKLTELSVMYKIRLILQNVERCYNGQPCYLKKILQTLSDIHVQIKLTVELITSVLKSFIFKDNYLFKETMKFMPNKYTRDYFIMMQKKFTISTNDIDNKENSNEENAIAKEVSFHFMNNHAQKDDTHNVFQMSECSSSENDQFFFEKKAKNLKSVVGREICHPEKCLTKSSTFSLPQKASMHNIIHTEKWCRDQDKVILEAFSQHGINITAYKIAAGRLHKTVEQVMKRATELMNEVKKKIQSGQHKVVLSGAKLLNAHNENSK